MDGTASAKVDGMTNQVQAIEVEKTRELDGVTFYTPAVIRVLRLSDLIGSILDESLSANTGSTFTQLPCKQWFDSRRVRAITNAH